MHNLLQVVEWSNQKFVGLGLQVYGLAMPLEELLFLDMLIVMRAFQCNSW